MDLVAGVRKEGSRGGRGEFQWSDVKESSHRENYLGHSVMAPVGRWQQNRDLSWYNKTDESADAAKQERKDEIKRIKEAEQEAMALALGLPVAPKSDSKNANMVPLGGKEVERAIQEGVTEENEDVDGVKGVGFGGFSGMPGMSGADVAEKLEAVGMVNHREGGRDQRHSREGQMRSDRQKMPSRRRDRSREDKRDSGRGRRSRRDDHDGHRHERRRVDSPRGDRERRRHRSDSNSRSRDRKRGEHGRHRHHRRSRSPHSSRRSRHERYERHERHTDYDRRR